MIRAKRTLRMNPRHRAEQNDAICLEDPKNDQVKNQLSTLFAGRIQRF
jgi:hypothetical protein